MDDDVLVRLGVDIAHGRVNMDEDSWADALALAPGQLRLLLTVVEYEANYIREEHERKVRAPAQRRAHRLLRSLLSPVQNAELTRLRCFRVMGTLMGWYRLTPRMGCVQRIEKHGKYWYAMNGYCLHDAHDENKMPPADVSIAHMLLLRSDEGAFLQEANAGHRTQLWDGDYMRMLNANRRGDNYGENPALVSPDEEIQDWLNEERNIA